MDSAQTPIQVVDRLDYLDNAILIADRHGLLTELVLSAMLHMKNNPSLSPEEAISGALGTLK